ncbi:MAG: OmpA family protein [Betaproteobacteria bacterium]|nr:OmpA family protein [Betaproteobacteria bacterium]
MKRHQHAACLLAGWAAFCVAAAHAADIAEREVGVLLGGGQADADLVGGRHDTGTSLLGVRYGQRLNDRFSLFGDLVYGAYDGNRIGVGDADVTTLRGGFEWMASRQPRYNWFLSGGLGVMDVNTAGSNGFTRPMASLGVGQSWEAGANDAFRWEVRADRSFGDGGLPGAGLVNFQALVGYAWGLGAPLDSDGDGVANRVDLCPGTPKGAKTGPRGCPLDTDGDGVFDGLDRCPGTGAGVKVDADGCPLDADGDGVPDSRDRCPSVAAPATSDGCPPRPAGPKTPGSQAPESQSARPAETGAPAKLTLDGVIFDKASDRLRPESLTILDNVAATLKEWGEVKVEVAGHTDSVGQAAFNRRLSQRRAEAVRAYLLGKGVAASRLIARGYGESEPVADNKTAAGRAKNRRVELIPRL